MSNIQPFHGNAVAQAGGSRLPSATTKALRGLQHNTVVTIAQVQAQGYVAREALFAVADLSELEGQLATMCPLAASRLEFIANAAAMSIARTLSDFR